MNVSLSVMASLWGRGGDGFQASIKAQREAGVVLDEHWLGLPELEAALCETSVCTDGRADLVLVPADWLPRLAQRGAIRPLDQLLGSAPLDGWPAAWAPAFVDVVRFDFARLTPSSQGSGASVWGIPFHDGPPIMMWRRDLYDDPAEQDAYREATSSALLPPATWQEFDRHVEWFTRPEQNLWGTVFAGAPDGHNNVYDFVTQLRARGGDLLDEKGEPSFGGASGRDALAWLRAHVRAGRVPPWSHELDSVQSGAAFAAGQVALMVNWAGYAQGAESSTSLVRGRVGAGVVPRNIDGHAAAVINAFWALAVTTGARHPVEAWNAVRTMVSAEGDVRTTLGGSSGTRLSTWRDPRILHQSPTFGLFEQAHRASRPLPLIPELPALVGILSHLVDEVVWGDGGLDEQLAAAVAVARAALSGESLQG